MFKLLYGFLILVFLSGCASRVEEKIKYVDRYIITEVPSSYLSKTKATPPIDVNIYMGMSEKERERTLAALSISLYGDLASCNADKESVVKILEDQKKRYDR